MSGGNVISDGRRVLPYEAQAFTKVECIYTQAQVDALVDDALYRHHSGACPKCEDIREAERERCAEVVREYDDWPIDRDQMNAIAAKIMEGK